MFPIEFTELTFGLSDVLKVAPFTFYQVDEIFGVARYGVGDFFSLVGCKKRIVCLTLSKKRTGKAAWLHFLIPAGCWPEEFSCGSVEWTSRSRRLALRL